ncbi:MAG: PAS domain-containing sensor histidine kinase [Acidimicrobiia bacterium]|nr:PAS domain-containing sensor histidine kinase [Acidimicrobiia bacterium]
MTDRGDSQPTREDRHRRAFLSAALPGIWLDARGRIVEVNDAAAELLDVKEDFISGRPAVSIVDPEDRHDLVNFFIEANASGEGSILRTVRVLAGDGPRSVKVGIAYVAADEDTGFFMQLHDLTDLKVTEAALDESEQSYRSFFEDHAVAMYRSRPDGEIVEANFAFASMAGYPHPKYLLSLNATELFIRPQDRDAQKSELERTGTLRGRDFELRREDGSAIWVRDFAKEISRGDGTVIYEGALFEVTERYLAEAQLRNRALQQASISALGQLALQSQDAHAVSLSAVRMTQEVLRLDSAALVRGEPLKSFARWDAPDLTATILDELDAGWLMSKVPGDHAAVTVTGPEGGFVTVLPVPDVNGQTGLLVGISRDDPNLSDDDVHFLQAVTTVIAATLERSESRHRLEALVQSKDEFIASISHEVRTPLTVVMGIAHELDSRWNEVEPQERAELLELIVGQTSEMSDLIEDLLVAARADIGKLPIHVEPLDARTVISEVVESVRTTGELSISVSEHSPVVYADPVRLRQIMRNLITNAVRYGGDEIRITVSHDDHRVWIDVADNGEGVPPESREAIFEAYERAHRSAGRPGSVGLGLTVSRRLARLMDGDLRYRFDEGSVFTLELAAAPALMFWNGSG